MKEAFLGDVDADTAAFDEMMSAMRMPKATPDQRKQRVHAIREARRKAIETPLGVLQRCVETLECIEVALQGNPNARSDAGVASALVGTCAQGAWMNVMINLQDLKDIERKENYRTQVEALLSTVLNRVEEQSASVQEFLRTNL